eukprot:Opistho-2@20849
MKAAQQTQAQKAAPPPPAPVQDDAPQQDHPQLSALSLVVSDPRTLVLMLNSPEAGVCGQACEALSKFAEQSDKNRSDLLKVGALRPVLELLGSADALVLKNASLCLATLSESVEVRKEIRHNDGLEALVELLSLETDNEIQENATLALAHMAADFASKVEIFRLGGLEKIVKLLQHTDPDVQGNVTHALSLMLEEYNCRSIFGKLNGIGPLLDLLTSEYTEIQEHVLLSIAKCAQDAFNRAEIRKLGGMEKLAAFLDASHEDLHESALNALANCLEDNESMELFQKSGGLQTLLGLMKTSEAPVVLQHAALAIARAAKAEESRLIVSDENGLPPLLRLIASEHANVAAAGAFAIAMLSESRSISAAVGQVDGLSPLMALLSRDDTDVLDKASLALANCSVNMENRKMIQQLGGIEILVGLLSKESSPTTQANAAVILSNLSKDATYRADIRKAGGIAALVAAMEGTKDADVQSKTALAIAESMYDAEGRAELREKGGVRLLVALLKSESTDVRRNSAWAIASCAGDELTALEITSEGGLEILQDLAESTTKQNSKFASLALDKLLHHNLPAKYWLRGTLAPADQTRDGFYDMGQSRSGSAFATLTDLQARPVDKRRAVVLVDSSSDAEFARQIDYAIQTVKPCETIRTQAERLAVFVAECMGGVVAPERLANFSFELPISQIKVELQSNVVPVGSIRTGIFYHRALLFKAIADRIGLSVSLVRGVYNRAWNTVALGDGAPLESSSSGRSLSSRGAMREYVVDLMHDPGHLYEISSSDAQKYMRL